MGYIGNKELKIDSWVVDYTHINSSGSGATTAVIGLFPIRPNAYPMFLRARVKTAFAGVVTAPTVKVGDETITDLYLRNQPIDKAGDLRSGGMYDATGVCQNMHMSSRKSFTVGAQMNATFTSASGNFGSLTAGEIEFVYGYVE